MSVTVRTEDTDAALVERCLDGDRAAWDILLARHGSLVWAIARRAQLGEEDAADVFQNTWTIALEQLSQLRDAALFERWLGTVARHQSLRVRRGYGIARSAREHVAREDVDERVPEEELATIERRHRVHAALQQIGERCARLLQLLYFEPLTPAYADIAKRLDMRIGSIGPTRARCLDQLRKQIGGGFDD